MSSIILDSAATLFTHEILKLSFLGALSLYILRNFYLSIQLDAAYSTVLLQVYCLILFAKLLFCFYGIFCTENIKP